MKIRQGFVSNSSSEAFICGVWGGCKYNIKETIKILQKMLDFYNDLEDQDLDINDVFKAPKIATEKDIDLLDGWDVSESRVKDKLLIYSAEDNSIPYLLFGMIEQKFDADRIHLG